MANCSYFDESFTFTTLSLTGPFDLPSGKSKAEFLSSEPENGIPSYNTLYTDGPPPDFLPLSLTYLSKSLLNDSLSGVSSPKQLFFLESQEPVPSLKPAPTRQSSLPPYDPEDVSYRSTPTGTGIPSQPPPLTPPPKYEAQPQANGNSGKRKALCIGINYYTEARGKPRPGLRSCVRDAKNMRELLIDKFRYRPEDVILLTDEPSQREPMFKPTRFNIIHRMKWLVHDAQPGDTFVFQYAGHGGQVDDKDGDEDDDKDETICPMDTETAGPIIDDDLHDIMVKPLPPGCRLTAIYDSCHSGTALDLPCTYTRDPHRGIVGSKNKLAMHTRSSSADVICWSACRDCETAADTRTTGAMTHAFTSAFDDGREHSVQSLFVAINKTIRLNPVLTQRPQLSSSHPLDITRKFTM